jgi:hypothetical protein
MKTNMNKKLRLDLLVKRYDEAIDFPAKNRWAILTVAGNEGCLMGARDANVIQLSAPVRGAAETELDSLKERLLQPLMEKTSDQDAEAALRRAGTEAAALAWTTPFPLLFLPALLDEKVDRAERYLARQKAILQRGTCRAMAA